AMFGVSPKNLRTFISTATNNYRARIDANSNGELEEVGKLVEFCYRAENCEAGMSPPLGIVVVRLGPAEIRHHTIAKILGDTAPIALDCPCGRMMVIGNDFAPPLGIEMACDLGRAPYIAEENRQMTPLTLGNIA